MSQAEIEYIVRNQSLVEKWERLNPVVFYKDKRPHGLISVNHYRDGVLISSCAINNEQFTRKMIVHIRKIADICKVYIMHDKNSLHISKAIRSAFGKSFLSKTLVTKDFVITVGKRRKNGGC